MTWSEIQARWKAESPVLFKKLQNFGASLFTAGTAGLAIPIIPTVHFPPIIGTVSGYFIVSGFCIGVISKLTCKDTNVLPNQK